ncbi:MAG: NUDIX domain-containing protein, partial [Clostridia bacterium]|nr:NUDIX domain-containing protein [Clostridia bacterium]
MDISFKTPEGRFNLRACAVIIEKGRLLAMRDGHSPYFYLPGGRVRMNEAADAALRRELREELGVEGEVREIEAHFFFVHELPGLLHVG